VKPRRIQRKRVSGWRMPEGAVYVGRPTKWGNPFRYRTSYGLARVPAVDGSPWEYEGRISAAGTRHDCYHPDGTWTVHNIRYMTRAECVHMYHRALAMPDAHLHIHVGAGLPWLTVQDVQRELAGMDLACWCPIDDGEGSRVPCHADVLLEIANGGDPS